MIKCQNIKQHKIIHVDPRRTNNYPGWHKVNPRQWFKHPAYDNLKLSIIYTENISIEDIFDECYDLVEKDSICILMCSHIPFIEEVQLPNQMLILSDVLSYNARFLPPILHWPAHWVTYGKHYKPQENSHATEFFCPVHRGRPYRLKFLTNMMEKNLLNKKNYTLHIAPHDSVVPIQKDQNVEQNPLLNHLYCHQRYHADLLICLESDPSDITEKTFQNLSHTSPIIWPGTHVHDFMKDFGFDLNYEGIDPPTHDFDLDKLIVRPDYKHEFSDPRYGQLIDQYTDILKNIVDQGSSTDLYYANYKKCLHNQSVLRDFENMHRVFAEKILTQWQNL